MVSYNPFDEFFKFGLNPFWPWKGQLANFVYLTRHTHFSAFRDLGAPIKLPKFYDDDGLLWFKVAEAIFNFRGLSDDKRKCELLLSALDHRHLTILEFPLAHLGEHPYDDLKICAFKALCSHGGGEAASASVSNHA